MKISQCLNSECLQKNSSANKFCEKCGSKLRLRDRYYALNLIGQGGFGKTFLAVDEDKPSKPYCVIKQFYPSAQGTDTHQKASELFEQEAVRLDSLGSHSQIPELLAYFTQDGRQYLIQEYIKGQNLMQELAKTGVFNEAKIYSLFEDLLPVLEFIHQKDVIHRDIKPENIIRCENDKKLFLVDFGAAKHTRRTALGVTGTVIGSAEYIAPEQSRGKAIFASDLYSLGVTCLHLLTQVSPFDLYDIDEEDWIWRQHLKENYINEKLASILDKLVRTSPKKRFQSASEVLDGLSFSKSKTPSRLPSPPPTVPTKYKKSKISLNPVQKSSSHKVPVQDFPPLISSVGVDYSALRQLLAESKWKEADYETYKVMIEAVGKYEGEWFSDYELEKFPCEDLEIINNLWLEYSQGRFGFSIQKKTWLKVGGKLGVYDNYKVYEKLSDLVGWYDRKWKLPLLYSQLKFEVNAESGHLPCGWCFPDTPAEWGRLWDDWEYNLDDVDMCCMYMLFVFYTRMDKCKL